MTRYWVSSFLSLAILGECVADKSVLYRNLGGWEFANVTARVGIQAVPTFQAAWADFDNDGYPALITGGKLYRNPGGSTHWLKVRLEGSGKVNRAAIVRLTLGKQVLTREVEVATGESNQNDLALHFGLGDHAGSVAERRSDSSPATSSCPSSRR